MNVKISCSPYPLVAIVICLAILKLSGVIGWSWWVVAAPILAVLALHVVALLLWTVIAAVLVIVALVKG